MIHSYVKIGPQILIPQEICYKDISFNLEYQEDFVYQNESESEDERGVS